MLDIQYTKYSVISDKAIQILVPILIFVGVANFAVNVINLAGGNILLYFKHMGDRQDEIALYGGTTLGYLFTYLGLYLWFFKIKRSGLKYSALFILFVIVSVLMKASQGRVLATMMYLLSFFALAYFLTQPDKRLRLNFIFGVALISFVILAISLYTYRSFSARYLSTKTITKNMTKEEYDKWQRDVGIVMKKELLSGEYYLKSLIAKGNVPNIPIFMKIINDWKSTEGYWYGKSLVNWTYNILPSRMRPDAYQPSVMIKQLWYKKLMGGSLPPTGVGEMYINFGFLGPFLGMFLFGSLCAWLFNMVIKRRSFWFLLVFVHLTLTFIMIYPKGEFDNISLLTVVPFVFLYFVSRGLSMFIRD